MYVSFVGFINPTAGANRSIRPTGTFFDRQRIIVDCSDFIQSLNARLDPRLVIGHASGRRQVVEVRYIAKARCVFGELLLICIKTGT
jgi:hypothetical protein